MPRTMKAAVVHEFGKPLSIEEMPIPQPGPGQIQVAVQASGYVTARLEDINSIFDQMEKGEIEGRIVMEIAG